MRLFILLLLLICNNAFAQLIELTCVNPKDNFTLNFQLDEENNAVLYAGRKYDATFSSSSIVFTIQILNGNKYLHIISRMNGVMNIQDLGTKSILSSMNCAVEKKRF
jgi:hypothetical protein